jgi:hypothetical protein
MSAVDVDGDRMGAISGDESTLNCTATHYFSSEASSRDVPRHGRVVGRVWSSSWEVNRQNCVGGNWGTEPNGDTYLRVGLELSPENGTRLPLVPTTDFVPKCFVRPTRTEHGLTEQGRTRHQLGLG